MRVQNSLQQRLVQKRTQTEQAVGQSLVEYALILALVGVAFGFALAATGPAIGNVFSNTIFNLVGATEDIRDIGGPEDFWLTVTWVAENPVIERPLPTRTPGEPTPSNTPGPSPTPTDITPTATKTPTSTPLPTATPLDIGHYAPYINTVNTLEEEGHFRVNAEHYLGVGPWTANYYSGMSLSGSPLFTDTIAIPDDEMGHNLAYDWGGGGPTDGLRDNFSAKYTREIYIDPNLLDGTTISERTINISATSDDGVRVWLLREGQDPSSCSATGVVSGGSTTTNDEYGDPSTDCLVIDHWRNRGPTTNSTIRTLEAGVKYTVQVDYYENGGGAELFFEMGGVSSNPDDRVMNPDGTVNELLDPHCSWVRQDFYEDANSLQHMWDIYNASTSDRDEFPLNMRCYLEFRGYVYVPGPADEGAVAPDGITVLSAMDSPELVFWDVWDFQDGNKTAWIEVAEYLPKPGSPDEVDRDALVWQRIDLHTGASRNYNWTRHVIDLTNVGGTSYVGKRLTFRFGMQNLNSGNIRRWYIDDIEVRDASEGEFPVGTLLTMNGPDAAEDFITSGQWELTGDKVVVAPDGTGVDCCSYELRPGRDYARFGTSGGDSDAYADWPAGSDRWDDETLPRIRIHYVELDGWVNIVDDAPDDEGDLGDPLLTFYHSYILDDDYVGMEIQYTTDPYNHPGGARWAPIPASGGGDPEGLLLDFTVDNKSTSEVEQPSMAEENISLVGLEDLGISRYRLRFALLVSRRAGTDDGWWIDNVYIHRDGGPRFLDYPFDDNAEIDMRNWQLSGWSRINIDARDGEHAYTDSATGPYDGFADSSLRFSYPIDLLNDTPENLDLADRNPAGGNSGGAAIDPVLTFWHWRDLDRGNVQVEWRRMDETDDDWRLLWAYVDRMTTVPGRTDDDTRRQNAWEYVFVDLSSIIAQFDPDPANLEDDDILIRFRLLATDDNRDNRDGLYIDDIDINERPDELVHQLWQGVDYEPGPSEGDPPTCASTISIGGEDYGCGDGATFVADGESPEWFENWRLGGDWDDITWEQRNGLRAFHESPVDQEEAYANQYAFDDIVKTRPYSHNVMELARIIDLRATPVEDQPTLYFWSRHYTGNDDEIIVQISEEQPGTAADIDADIAARCGITGIPQCYEQERGWGPWLTTNDRDEWPWYRTEWNRTFTWQREQIDLSEYASPDDDTPGSRIRVRFVYNSMNNKSDKADGWYIDNVSVQPLKDNVIRNIRLDGNFSDNARDLGNWVAEGNWGLSPELYYGSAGGPATLGTWREYFWNCDECESLAPGGTSGSHRFRVGADIRLDGSDGSDADASRIVLDISYDVRRGSPRTGINDDRYLGRWVLDTPVVGSGGVRPGEYSFITISDDGVRMKYEILNADGTTSPVGGTAPTSDSEEWNVIYNWTDHGRTGDMGGVLLENGNRYRITLEYYEKGGDAVIILTTAGSNFSFTDSPKQGAGTSFPDIPATPRSDPSLILDGVVDLEGLTQASVTYRSYWETYGTNRVEVSTDGGFSWTSAGLQDDFVDPLTGATERFDDPTFGGDRMPNDGDWDFRSHNLADYVDQQLMLRFRFDYSSRNNLTEDRDGGNDFYTGWWITDITIGGG